MQAGMEAIEGGPGEMGGMTADMMDAIPPGAMGGMGPDHMANMPPEAMGGMDASMMQMMPRMRWAEWALSIWK